MVNFMHYIVHSKYPKFECTVHTMFPTCYSGIPQCNAGVFFPEEKKKLNKRETNIVNDGVSGFRLEMSTIYLRFNIENVTFKINKKYLDQRNVTFKARQGKATLFI